MTLDRIATIRRRFFADLAVVAAIAALIGLEAASLASAADELAPPSGLVIDARGEPPAGVAVDRPCDRLLIDARLARGELAPATGAFAL